MLLPALQLPAVAHASYSVAGLLSMNAEGGAGPIFRENPPAALLEVSDSDTAVGPVGNGGTGNYAVSISTASISASTGAQNGFFQTNWYYTGTATTSASFIDDLRFTVPAGTYPEGVYVSAHLHVEGGVSGGEVARALYNFSFDTDSVLVDTIAPAPPISENIVLTVELVAPGATLNNPSTKLARFAAAVESVSSTSFSEPQVATSSIAGEVTCLVIPPGVTWTSDSGAFGAPICTTTALPTLSSWMLVVLVAALVGTVVWMNRGRPYASV